MVVPSDSRFAEIGWRIEVENAQRAMDVAWDRLDAIDPCDSEWFLGIYDKAYYPEISPREQWSEWLM